ncbi:phage tail assembly protein [Mitsuaria sp. GD03876]|uniref:phage tail assembly protein n=1 Tax=Mitsuaria sp. GD03876 TaxID=2975399 RepID=UPI002448E792|nr:phage tail assembly protein [Mitsuaria sp. GD03876]MDH0866462.1 phage tail assembly protein [Mitsuaria sp. GD03876]
MTTTTITLDQPIKRGTQEINQVELRKPSAGELRGVSLFDLVRMDVAAAQTILPRITVPSLTRPEIDALDPADLFQLSAEVAAFLSPKAAKEQDYQTA